MNSYIFEDAFDNLQQSSDDIMQDVIDDNVPDLVDDFKYKIHITISGIVPQIRKPDTFLYYLQKFDRILSGYIDLSRLFEDAGPCIYTVNESDVLYWAQHSADRYNGYVKNALFTNAYGQKMFNDLKFVEDDALMETFAKNFSFVFQCNINETQANVINLLKFIKITIEKVSQKIFSYRGKSKCKVFSMWIRKTTADEKSRRVRDYFSQASSYLENVINKKDDKATRNVIVKMSKFMLGTKNNTKMDKWFSSGSVSAPVQEIIKYFGMKVQDVYVDEDDTSVRIEVPEKVTMKTWSMERVNKLIEQTHKFFCFTVNGKLIIRLWKSGKNDTLEFCDHYLYPNINQMVIDAGMLTDEECRLGYNSLDLSRFYINDLKVKYETPTWRRADHYNKLNIKLNPNSKPKKFKETIK